MIIFIRQQLSLKNGYTGCKAFQTIGRVGTRFSPKLSCGVMIQFCWMNSEKTTSEATFKSPRCGRSERTSGSKWKQKKSQYFTFSENLRTTKRFSCSESKSLMCWIYYHKGNENFNKHGHACIKLRCMSVRSLAGVFRYREEKQHVFSCFPKNQTGKTRLSWKSVHLHRTENRTRLQKKGSRNDFVCKTSVCILFWIFWGTTECFKIYICIYVKTVKKWKIQWIYFSLTVWGCGINTFMNSQSQPGGGITAANHTLTRQPSDQVGHISSSTFESDHGDYFWDN